jgi:hypothetical protein
MLCLRVVLLLRRHNDHVLLRGRRIIALLGSIQ